MRIRRWLPAAWGKAWVIQASAVLFLAACCTATAPRTTASAGAATRKLGTNADSPSACRACNGVWGRHGLAGHQEGAKESCICAAKDAGKECRDGADCEGQCLANDARFEVTVQGPPARGWFVGRCSAMVFTFGCFASIPEGTRAAGPTTASERPGPICVD
jgi:hypothetical protein